MRLFFTTYIALLAVSFSEKITMQAPNVSEEEQHSTSIPKQYKCDSCRAIAHQIYNSIDKRKSTFGNGSIINEDDAIEILEDACDEGRYGTYGLSVIGGRNKLTGPGIPVPHDDRLSSSGGFITMSGGMWPKRLKSRCTAIVDTIGETKLVEMVLKSDEGNIAQKICTLVSDCSVRKGKSDRAPPVSESGDVLAKLKSDLSKQQRTILTHSGSGEL